MTGAGDGSECISDSCMVFGARLMLESGFLNRSKSLKMPRSN